MTENKLTCPHCDYTTIKRYNLKRHINLVHNIIQCHDAPKTNFPAEGAQNPNFPAEEAQNPNNHTAREPNTIDPCSHQCEKCEHYYTSIKSLKQHAKRCKGKVNPLQCQACMKIFSSLQVKYNHKKFCKGRPEPVEPAQTAETINNYQQCTINNGTTTNNTHNNITINIANFNAEKTEHITQEFARQCFDKGVYGISPMVDKIYFNEEKPENHNVKLNSLTHSLVEVYKNNGWTMEGLLTTIDNMISNSTGTMMQKLNRALNVTEDLQKWNAIQNMKSDHKRKIREHTKSKLVERRNIDNSPVSKRFEVQPVQLG